MWYDRIVVGHILEDETVKCLIHRANKKDVNIKQTDKVIILKNINFRKTRKIEL